MQRKNLSHLIKLRRIGQMDYRSCWQAMRQQAEEIATTHQHQIWQVSHPAVFTLGQAGKREHLLAVAKEELVQTDRGGQVTWHGPGQIILYPLLHLASLGLGPKRLVVLLEQAVIDTLAGYGLQAKGREGAPGVYVGDAKIASVGLRIRKGVSYHGLALNHCNDLAPFTRINPCGYRELKITRVQDLTQVDLETCSQDLTRNLMTSLQ